MELWIKLLLEWAVPVFKTLAYLRDTERIRGIPVDLDGKLHKMQGIVQVWADGDSIEPKKDNPTPQEPLAKLGHQLVSEIPDLIQNLTLTMHQSDLDFQIWEFQQQKTLQQQLVAYNRETLLKVAAYQRETTLTLPEVNKILDRWPLRLLPSQLLERYTPNQPLPLRIIIAPPQIPREPLGELVAEIPELELGLAQRLREFLHQNYPLQSTIRPTEFLGGAWESERFHGESSIKALFGMLKSEPTLILESEIDGDWLNFRMAYWGLGQSTYCYTTIFKLPYRDFINESAKARAKKWQEIRDKLLALGKNPDDIYRLGGDNVFNLALLEEAEQLQKAGIDIRELTLPYKISRQDWDSLCQFLSTCHCLVAGWISDIYHLIHYDTSPLMPELLPHLCEAISDEHLLQTVIQTTISIYQDVLQSLASDRPCWKPELTLKLAQSLTHLPDKTWARTQVNDSLKAWLQQRQLPELEGIPALDAMQSVLTPHDRDYCETLKLCLTALEDDGGIARVQELLDAIASLQHPPSLSNLSPVQTFTELSGKVAALAITPDGQTLFSCGDDNTIKQWDLTNSSPTPTHQFIGHSGGVFTLTLSRDGQLLASSDQSKNRSYIKIWNLPTGKLLWTLSGHRKQIHSLALSPDGQTLASGSHKIKLWNLQTGEPFRTLFGHKEWVYSLAISPDGKTLVSGSEDKTVKLWHLSTGNLLSTLNGHKKGVRAVAISLDCQTVVSGSEDHTIKLWDFESGKLLSTLTAHSGAVYAVAISPDSQYLISGSHDQTLKIWHLSKGELLASIPAHTDAVSALAISPDGQTLVSGSTDKTIKIWRAA